MTIHVPIVEAKDRLPELVAATLRGEDVVLDEAGRPQVRLVAMPEEPAIAVPDSAEDLARRIALRKSAFGMYQREYAGYSTDVPRSMTDEDLEDRFRRKFGPAD